MSDYLDMPLRTLQQATKEWLEDEVLRLEAQIKGLELQIERLAKLEPDDDSTA